MKHLKIFEDYNKNPEDFKEEGEKKLIDEIMEQGGNMVTCGMCGKIFIHDVSDEELTCPYCNYTSDPADFPDYDYFNEY